MKLLRQKKAFLLLCLSLIFLEKMVAQKASDCIKTAKLSRPTFVLVKATKLDDFYRNYGDEANFSEMKIVKSELAYYLLAKEASGSRIFAFELESKGKKLFLNKKLSVQSCSEGTLSLDTFLQDEGKIMGCRKADHQILQSK